MKLAGLALLALIQKRKLSSKNCINWRQKNFKSPLSQAYVPFAQEVAESVCPLKIIRTICSLTHFALVLRLMDEAFADGVLVAICSTSNEAAVTTIARKLLGEERLAKIQIFAGDVVKNKKPAPDVYLLAASTLNVEPARCWVVEDSEIGLKAAKAAGMKCVVTKSIYTVDEDFQGADVIVDNLDKGLDGPITANYLDYKASSKVFKVTRSTDNAETFAAGVNVADMFSKIAKGEMGNKGFPF